jgi:hypothetical protein
MKQHTTDLFTWSDADGCGIADVSDLGPEPFIRVYPDACDQGLELVSSRTGRTERFYVHETLRSPEGELQGWRLEPVSKALRGKASLLVIND